LIRRAARRRAGGMDPTKWECAMSTKQGKQVCPVCDWEIKDQGRKVRVDDRDVVVCCDDCAEKLRAKSAGARATGKR
jgi:predicted amidophosphoribosyltransferase